MTGILAIELLPVAWFVATGVDTDRGKALVIFVADFGLGSLAGFLPLEVDVTDKVGTVDGLATVTTDLTDFFLPDFAFFLFSSSAAATRSGSVPDEYQISSESVSSRDLLLLRLWSNCLGALPPAAEWRLGGAFEALPFPNWL